MNDITKKSVDSYKKSIDKVKAGVAEAERLLEEFERDYNALDKAAFEGKQIQKLEFQKSQTELRLKGKLFEIAGDTLNEYNNHTDAPPKTII